MKKNYCKIFICLLLWSTSNSFCQSNTITVNEQFKKIDLSTHVSYFLDSGSVYTAQQVLSKNSLFTPNTQSDIYFKTTTAACWLRFKVVNTGATSKSLMVFTEGLDSLNAFCFKDDSLIKSQTNGAHLPPSKRSFNAFSQGISFELPPNETYIILLKAKQYNTPLSVYPFVLADKSIVLTLQKTRDFCNSIYIGGMLMMILFGFALFIFLGQRVYLYYVICASCSLTFMFIYHDLFYLLFDSIPVPIYNKSMYAILMAIIVTTYALFVGTYIKPIYQSSKLVGVLSHLSVILGIILIMLVFLVHHRITTFFWLFNFAGLLNIGLMVFYVREAIIAKYYPIYILLFATSPVLAICSIEIFGELHATPIQFMHQAYYISAFFEMIMLLLGLAWRFRLTQQEIKTANETKYRLQEGLYDIERKTREYERERIGRRIHDEILGQFTAIRYHLNQMFSRRELIAEDDQDTIRALIENALKEARKIPHDLLSDNLAEKGLMASLKNIYEYYETPQFIIQSSAARLDINIEKYLYSIICEAIHNILKYAEASEVNINLNHDEKGNYNLLIEDDGRGFDTKISTDGKGLSNITKLVQDYLGGNINIESNQFGTSIMIEFKA